MKAYRRRILDDILRRKLQTIGAVLVQGPKWCGKTTTCEQIAASVLYMGDPDTRESNRQLADISIKSLLEGAKPRLIDEWQEIPKLWDAVRFHVDHADGMGQFILTGSAVPPDLSQIVHSGTGRVARLTMRPMSLWESGESSGTLSLQSLFAGADFTVGSAKQLELADIARLVCRGGWPQAVLQSQDLELDCARDYFDAVVETDVSRLDGVSRQPNRVRRLLRSYARLQGTQSSLATIRKDLASNEGGALNEDTVASYLNVLRKIFVVEDMPAWSPNLRSKAQIRTTDTRYFVDPSVAAAALGAGPGDLVKDLRTLGLLFETLAVRDLRVYADALGGDVLHYHDSAGNECDAVVHLRDGSYGLVEIKLGGDMLVAEGADSLCRLASKLDTNKMKSPAFKMVLTAVGQFAYRRKDDNVIVCPLSALRP